jgi:DNA-binding CsgD family transcriptional regulator
MAKIQSQPPGPTNVPVDMSVDMPVNVPVNPPVMGSPDGLPKVPVPEAIPVPAPLSDRELQVIELVVAGLTNEQIADRLEISKRTVDNHVSNILTKTDTKNRVAMVRWALQWGKVCLDEVNCCVLPPYQQPQ